LIERVTIAPGKESTPKLDMQPARIRVRTMRSGQMVPGNVELYRRGATQNEPPLYEHPSNSNFTVAAHTYRLIAAARADENGPRIEAELPKLRLETGKLMAFSADLSDGSLQVSATENGRRADGLVTITRRGSKSPTMRGGVGHEFVLPPGRYLVETTLESAANFATHREEVWVRSKKKTSVRARFETGRLRVSAKSLGKPVDSVIYLSVPGADDYFNYFDAPNEVTLTPGDYEVTAEAEIDAPIKKRSQRVKVLSRRKAKLQFDFTPSRLVVEVSRAGRRVQVDTIRVTRAGGGGSAGKPNFDGVYSLWPGRYEIGVRLANGDEASDGPFEVAWGERITRRVELEHGTLTVSAKRGGKSTRKALILVFRPGAKKPTSELRPGQTIPLAPGTYDLRVSDGPNRLWHEGVSIRERKHTRIELDLAETRPIEDDSSLPDGELPAGELPAD
jgi:hypothetical protein